MRAQFRTELDYGAAATTRFPADVLRSLDLVSCKSYRLDRTILYGPRASAVNLRRPAICEILSVT